MTANYFNSQVDDWSNWARQTNPPQYDVALLKIWIQFERFLSKSFLTFAIGEKSDQGYAPDLKLKFENEEHFNKFMRAKSKSYIDYLPLIESHSDLLFVQNPFAFIFEDATFRAVYEDVKSIRNYMVHESTESKTKLIKRIYSGDATQFKEPNEYLSSSKRKPRIKNFTYLTEKLKEICELIESPPSN